MTKKILALVLALMMVVCALPLSVAADDAALPSLGDQLNKIPIVSNLIIRIDTDNIGMTKYSEYSFTFTVMRNSNLIFKILGF